MKNYLQSIMSALISNRGVGSTTAISQAVSDHGGILLCHDEREAKRLAATGIKTISIHNVDKLRGTREIIWIDPSALSKIIADVLSQKDLELRKYIISEVHRLFPRELYEFSKQISSDRRVPILDVLLEISDLDKKGFIYVHNGMLNPTK